MPAHRLPLLLCLAACTPADDLPFTPNTGGDDVFDVVYPTDDVGDTGDTGRCARPDTSRLDVCVSTPPDHGSAHRS